MNVYQILTVQDNPLFEGFAMRNWDRLSSCPIDWKDHMQSWEARRLSANWEPQLELEGNVAGYQDFPCIMDLLPAFSQRAVDVLKPLLVENGELLPFQYQSRTYYLFNCTKIVNSLDLERTEHNKIGKYFLPNLSGMAFKDECVESLVIFRDRGLPMHLFCTEIFKNHFEAAGLQGMVFVKVWKNSEGFHYGNVRYDAQKAAEKWKPKEGAALDITGNSLVIRLYCERKKPTKAELSNAEQLMLLLEKQLKFNEDNPMETYFGYVEGHEAVDFEIRVGLSAPDVERLVQHLLPTLKKLPWPGKYQVAKRRGELFDTSVKEEYLSLLD